MNKLIQRLVIFVSFIFCCSLTQAQKSAAPQTKSAAQQEKVSTDSASSNADDTDLDSATAESMLGQAAVSDGDDDASTDNGGFYKSLKTKFIEGNAGFMSLVALALVLGLAFCVERVIYLSLSEINAKKLMKDVDGKLMAGDVEGAKTLCRNTRGPVASICYQGLERIEEPIEDIERSVASYGSVQSSNLEKGCSWITLFIAMAPSLGFLGTVIGMVMAFDQIQTAGDISPTIRSRYEGGFDHNHLWYHRGTYPSDLLQLYPLEDRASHLADGGECHLSVGLSSEI